MDRRLFIQSGLALATWFDGAYASNHTRERSGDTRSADLAFYDRRFPRSRELARALTTASRLRSIEGDATDAAAFFATQMKSPGPFTLRGVTTESVPFCLQQMARSSPVPTLRMRRIDRDLFEWTLTTRFFI